MRILTEIYRSSLQDEMYLYIDKTKGLTPVPEQLMQLFGKPELVFTLLLTPEKKLARAATAQVLADLKSQGYYLQMPPPREEYLLNLYSAPTRASY